MNNKSIRMIVSISLNALFIAIAVIVVVTVGTKAYTFGNKIFNERAVDAVDNAKVVDVTISSGVSAGQLASQLYDKGLIDDKTVFYFQVKLSDGTYSLNTSMKPTDMMKALSGVSDSSEDGK
jgi:cell division protein YceG involved in septum cleavage